MKKLHSFDEVFDGQKVFRKILEAMSNPGRKVSIAEQSEKMHSDGKVFLAIGMTLLDNEVTFATCGDHELAENMALITLSKEESLENADYIFVEEENKLKEVIEKAKCGTLEDPQKSATIIVKADIKCSKTLHLYGAGIDGTLSLNVPEVTAKALEFRKQQNYEYPQGIDFIFVTADGELFSIPRLVMDKEEK